MGKNTPDRIVRIPIFYIFASISWAFGSQWCSQERKNPGIIRMSGFLCYLKAAILHTAAMLAHGIAGRSNPMGSIRHTNHQKRNHPDGWFLVVSEHDRSIADPYGNTPPTASAPCRLGICFDRRSKPAALHTAAMLAHGIAGRSNPMGSVRHTNHQKRNHPDGWFLFCVFRTLWITGLWGFFNYIIPKNVRTILAHPLPISTQQHC